jgi:hypothetical protein
LFLANRTQGIFWWHLNSLILTFIFKIVDFAHFFVDLQPTRSKFEITSYTLFTTPRACYILKMTFLAFPQKKPLIKTSKKHHFFGTFNQIADQPEAKIKITEPIHSNSDNFPDSQQISKLTDISSRILVSLKKAEGLVFNRG